MSWNYSGSMRYRWKRSISRLGKIITQRRDESTGWKWKTISIKAADNGNNCIHSSGTSR